MDKQEIPSGSAFIEPKIPDTAMVMKGGDLSDSEDEADLEMVEFDDKIDTNELIDQKQKIIEDSPADKPPPEDLFEDDELTLQEGEHEVQTDSLNEDLKDEQLISD